LRWPGPVEMNAVDLVLRAYWERLHEKLIEQSEAIEAQIGPLLDEEIDRRGYRDLAEHRRYEAYHEACVAFLAERIEAYNPIGIQYTFDKARRKAAFELEQGLEWYSSKAEWEELVDGARARAEVLSGDEALGEAAAELIEEMGAYPDRSIISVYEQSPGLQKLPDYVVARAIEAVIR